MAQITIREKDLTGAAANSTFEVAVVPGLTVNTLGQGDYANYEYNTPYYFTNFGSFTKAMGDAPVKLTGAGLPYDYTDGQGITIPSVETQTNSDVEISTANVDAESGLTYQIRLDSTVFPNIDLTKFERFENLTVEPTQLKVGDTFSNLLGDTCTITAITGNPFIGQYTGTTYNDSGEIIPGFGMIEIVPNTNCTISYTYNDGETHTVTDANFATVYNGTISEDAFPVELTDIRYDESPSTDGYFFPAGTYDPGFVYAAELINAGIPIYYIPINGTTCLDVYDAMLGTDTEESIFDQFRDRGTFNAKYITTGGYPIYEYDVEKGNGIIRNALVKKVLEIAGALDDQTDDYLDVQNGRGDAIALIDHFEIDERPLIGAGSVFDKVNKDRAEGGLQGEAYLSYGAMFTPYAEYDLARNYVVDGGLLETMRLPASFAYLICLAKQLNGILPTYEAIAGVSKGTVTNIVFDQTTNRYKLCTKKVLTNYIANQYNAPMGAGETDPISLDTDTPISINGLTQINPYGIIIWGDRTLKPKDKLLGVKATGVLPIRAMVCDIKKQMYQTARRYMYAANNDALWINFRNGVSGLLNQMQSGYGIKKYTLTKDMEKSKKNALYVNCSIVPVYPVDKFDITIEITDDDVEVNEA